MVCIGYCEGIKVGGVNFVVGEERFYGGGDV